MTNLKQHKAALVNRFLLTWKSKKSVQQTFFFYITDFGTAARQLSTHNSLPDCGSHFRELAMSFFTNNIKV